MLDVIPASPAATAWPLDRALVRDVLRTRLALERQIKSGRADAEQIVALAAMHLSSRRPNHASSAPRAAEGAFREAQLGQAWARLVAQASKASGNGLPAVARFCCKHHQLSTFELTG